MISKGKKYMYAVILKDAVSPLEVLTCHFRTDNNNKKQKGIYFADRIPYFQNLKLPQIVGISISYYINFTCRAPETFM